MIQAPAPLDLEPSHACGFPGQYRQMRHSIWRSLYMVVCSTEHWPVMTMGPAHGPWRIPEPGDLPSNDAARDQAVSAWSARTSPPALLHSQ